VLRAGAASFASDAGVVSDTVLVFSRVVVFLRAGPDLVVGEPTSGAADSMHGDGST
jgi:hypothetical protein